MPARAVAMLAGRIALWSVAIVAGLVVLVVGGGLLLLRTDAVGKRIAKLVEEQAGAALQGRLQLTNVRTSGMLQVCAEQVKLDDPQGRPALRAKEVCVSLDPSALIGKVAHVRFLKVVEPVIELTLVPGAEAGTTTTTLALALAAKKPPAPAKELSPPTSWAVEAEGLSIENGRFELRDAPGSAPRLALEGLALKDGSARWSVARMGVKLAVGGAFTAPGKLAALVSIDATLDGDPATGRATIKEVRVAIGKSGLVASGAFDLGKQSGTLQLRELAIEPRELELFLPKREDGAPALPLAGAIHGEADLASDGKEATLALRLHAGGGTLTGTAKSTLAQPYKWSLDLDGAGIDPAQLLLEAPRGTVAARLSAKGKGIPALDQKGPSGDVKLKLKVGPAKLDQIGALALDLDGSLLGSYLIVDKLTAEAIGVQVKGRGAASREELSLDLDVDAPDLARVGRNVGALAHKPALLLAGDAHLTARVTGSTKAPDAEVKLRGKTVSFGASLEADELAIDGKLQGKLTRPHGALDIRATRFLLGGVDLGRPDITAELNWPSALLRISANVRGEQEDAQTGRLLLVGNATLDARGDGIRMSDLFISWPGNRFDLVKPAQLKLGPQRTELLPLELRGPNGDLALAMSLWKPTATAAGRIEGTFALTGFDLDHLPDFALPRGLNPKGFVDAHLTVSGPTAAPDVDAQLELKGVEVAAIQGLSGKLHAALQKGRLRLDGGVSGPLGATAKVKASWPLMPGAQTAHAPLEADVEVSEIDLAKVAALGKGAPGPSVNTVHGTLHARLLAKGTLDEPSVELKLQATDLVRGDLHGLEIDSTLHLGGPQAELDADVLLFGHKALLATARVPFDLAHALRDPADARRAIEQSFTLTLKTNGLSLDELSRAGVAPAGSTGPLAAELIVSGTLEKPRVLLEASGKSLESGPVHEGAFQLKLALDRTLTLATTLHVGEATAKIDTELKVSAAEAVALVRAGLPRAQLDPLLRRTWEGSLTLEHVVVGKMAKLAKSVHSTAKAPVVTPLFQGVLSGKVSIAGTPQEPHLLGKLAMSDMVAGQASFGRGDVYFEADHAGAVVHLGIDPPGKGGTLLAHAQLVADLSASTLLDEGADAVLSGTLTGHLAAKALDLKFLSQAAPNLRRSEGILDADVELTGLLGRPWADGEAHLKGGAFEIVGAGVLEDISFDATFSPKELVLDRLTGTTGGGQFSTVLVLGRRTTSGDEDGLEFTGEVHLGDEEAARDRVDKRGVALVAKPVPLHHDGADLAELAGEMTFYGEAEQGQVSATVQIPKLLLHVLNLPDKKLPSLTPNPSVLVEWPGQKPALAGVDPAEMALRAQALRDANLRVDVALDLQEFHVVAADFELPVTSQMHLAWDASDPGKPVADGTVNVKGGTFSALGRRFTVDEATITETGGDIADPELEIQARYENAQAAVLVLISGTATDPQIDLSSTPAMDQDAIAFFLATGRLQGKATQSGGGVDLTNAASSVVGAALFGQLRKNLVDVLPVDVVSVEAGDGTSGPQASVGKYIGDRLFVGYRQRFTSSPSENQIEGRAEFLLGRRFASEGTYGDKTKGVSVLFTVEW